MFHNSTDLSVFWIKKDLVSKKKYFENIKNIIGYTVCI